MLSLGTIGPPVAVAVAGAAAALREPCLLLVGVEPAALPPGLAAALQCLGVSAVDAGRLVLEDAAGQTLVLHHPPALPIAILVAKGGTGLAAQLAGWCEARDPAGVPPLLAWPEEAAGITRLLLDRLRDAAAGTVRLRRELHLLRAQDLEMQERFAALEALVTRRGVSPLDLAFENPPAPGAPQPNLLAELGPAGIVQRLPVASAGLSAVALHVAAASTRPEGVLQASLATLEDVRVVAQWVVPLAALTPGWLALGLDRTLGGLPRTLDLTLRCESAEPPLLSLGGPQPLRMFQIRGQGAAAPALRRSLALQAWIGLPSVAVPGWVGHVPSLAAADRAGGLVEVALSDLALEQARGLDAASGKLVTPMPRKRAIGCHPAGRGATTAARLAGACPDTALLVGAGIRLDHPDAADVEFGIAVAADAAAAQAILTAARGPGPGEGWSGWTRLAALQDGQVSACLAEGAAGPRDIVLATRMAGRAKQDFAWAIFRTPTVTLPG